jgi:signal transduction histidine kinase
MTEDEVDVLKDEIEQLRLKLKRSQQSLSSLEQRKISHEKYLSTLFTELERSREITKTVLEGTGEAFFLCTGTGEILNEYTSIIRQWFKAREPNKNLLDYFQFIEDKSYLDWLRSIFEGGPSLPESRLFDFEKSTFEVKMKPYQNHFLFVIRDITDTVTLQAELEVSRFKQVTTAKLALLGEMAGGVAHEINNPLTILAGKVHQLKRYVHAETPESKEKIDEAILNIESVYNRIKKIVSGLKSFARDGGRDALTPCDIRSVVQESLDICGEKMKNLGIDLRISLPRSSPLTVSCRPVQISQIVVNLISNALDATEGQTKRVLEIYGYEKDNEVFVEVSDSGPGVSREIEEKIMQPFFTTKAIGKGTGLGLSISLGIADEHGGRLFLNRSKSSSTFVLQLPKVQLGKMTA